MKIYRIAKDTVEAPYNIYLQSPAGSRLLGRINAHSEKQAKWLFLKNDTSDCRAYLEMGYTLRASLDKEEIERRESIKEYEKEKEEDLVQNAWWND